MPIETARKISTIPAENIAFVSTAAMNTKLNIFATTLTVDGRLQAIAAVWTTEPKDVDLTPFWDEFQRLIELAETEA